MQIVTTHKNTDFDALASMIAATLIFPESLPVISRSVNPNVKSFISMHKDILNLREPDDIAIDEVKSIIIVDVNNWSRIERFNKISQKEGLEIILWDCLLYTSDAADE